MPLFDTTHVNLAGQVAIVTGGGRGLGRAMAQALSAAHAKVAVVSRTEAQLDETVDHIRRAGGQVFAFRADVTDGNAVEQMVQAVQQQLGEVDLLVNNAGVTGKPGPIWETDPDDWQNTLNVNVSGAYLCSVAVLKSMIKRGRGRIISIVSSAGLRTIMNGSGYCVSKAALIRLTECIADDSKPYGISTFAVDPGSVRTAMTEYLIESEEGRTYLPWYREFILNGGDVPPALSASLVTLLASGRFDPLSGRFIQVSDDIDEMLVDAVRIAKDELYTLRLKTV